MSGSCSASHRALAVLLDEPRTEPALFEDTCGLVADLAAANDHDLVGVVRRGVRRDVVCERLDAFGASHDDGPITRTDARVAAGDLHLPVAEDSDERERFEPVGLRDRLVGHRALRADLELGHLYQFAGERIDVDRGRQADDADDVLRGEEIRTDEEVDAEGGLVALPRLQVRRAFHPSDRERVAERLRGPAGDEVRPVVVRAGDEHVGVGDIGLLLDR